MIRFYTVEELFKTEDISDLFLDSFNRLTQSAQEIVKTKNNSLREWLVVHSSDLNNKESLIAKGKEKKQEDNTNANKPLLGNFVGNEVLTLKDFDNSLENIERTSHEVCSKESNIFSNGNITDDQEKTESNIELNQSELLEKMNKEYNSLNFNREIVSIKNLYLILLNKGTKVCSIHKKKLKKKKVLINGIIKELLSCDLCKRFFSVNQEEDIKKLKKAKILYKLIFTEKRIN